MHFRASAAMVMQLSHIAQNVQHIHEIYQFYKDIFPNPENLLKYITKNPNRISVNSDQSIIIKKNMSYKNDRIKLVKDELMIISSLV